MTALVQQLATSPPSSTATAAAAAAHGDESVTAACRLALFFPLGNLLTLTQTALRRVQPNSHPTSSIEACRQSQVTKLGLHLAEALIRIWTEQKDEGVAIEEPHKHAIDQEERDQGEGAAWDDVVKGLLRMALDSGKAAGSGPEISPDALLLKMLRSRTAFSHR